MSAQTMSQPTQEGVTRYPPSGYYMPDDLGVECPCTCGPGCPVTCKGECGCVACHVAYGDVLSAE